MRLHFRKGERREEGGGEKETGEKKEGPSLQHPSHSLSAAPSVLAISTLSILRCTRFNNLNRFKSKLSLRLSSKSASHLCKNMYSTYLANFIPDPVFLLQPLPSPSTSVCRRRRVFSPSFLPLLFCAFPPFSFSSLSV